MGRCSPSAWWWWRCAGGPSPTGPLPRRSWWWRSRPSNLDGFERYALSAFPLVLAGAGLTSGAASERVVLALAAAGLAIYAVLAFTNLYVP